MKNLLFIVNTGKISPNENGGASVYYSHLELLYKAGYKIYLLAVQWGEKDVYKTNDYAQVSTMLAEVIPYKITVTNPKKGWDRWMNALFFPEKFEYYFLNKSNTDYLHRIVAEQSIDLVWADWRWAGIWAGFSKLSLPVVYAHHDWEYKLAKLRKRQNMLQKFHTYQKKRVEFSLVQNIAGSVSGSYTEAIEIEKISHKKAIYIPTTYKKVTPVLLSQGTPNIVHLGGMGTTANRLGLERFLDVCWDDIKKAYPSVKLLVVGSLKQASKPLLEKLNGGNIVCKGFVEDLATELRPQDIHIVPWEYNTGTRTRIPVVFNYEQVLVATKASVAAFPEIQHQHNAMLCDHLEQMTTEIQSLLSDISQRHRISKQGKLTFMDTFMTENYIEKIKRFLMNITEEAK